MGFWYVAYVGGMNVMLDTRRYIAWVEILSSWIMTGKLLWDHILYRQVNLYGGIGVIFGTGR